MTLFPVLQQRPRVPERARRIYRSNIEATYGGLCAISGDRTNLDNEFQYLHPVHQHEQRYHQFGSVSDLGHFQIQLDDLRPVRAFRLHLNRNMVSPAFGVCSLDGRAESSSVVQRIPRSHSSASLSSRSAIALSCWARASLRYRVARTLLTEHLKSQRGRTSTEVQKRIWFMAAHAGALCNGKGSLGYYRPNPRTDAIGASRRRSDPGAPAGRRSLPGPVSS